MNKKNQIIFVLFEMLFLISQGVKFVNLNGKLFLLCQDLIVERNRKRILRKPETEKCEWKKSGKRKEKGKRSSKYLSRGTDNNKYDRTEMI